VLAEELVVIDGDAPLWAAARPYLDAALRLEQNGDAYAWYGWNKQQIDIFLLTLPSHCSLVIGVWEILVNVDTTAEEELLTMGVVGEIVDGEVCSIRTFDALTASGLRPTNELEPGFEDALEIMRAARTQVAPVAWALFTDKMTWNEWIFAVAKDDSVVNSVIDKGEMLATFARQGRCVLMGSQTAHQQH
jgi:hypothetical protein